MFCQLHLQVKAWRWYCEGKRLFCQFYTQNWNILLYNYNDNDNNKDNGIDNNNGNFNNKESDYIPEGAIVFDNTHLQFLTELSALLYLVHSDVLAVWSGHVIWDLINLIILLWYNHNDSNTMRHCFVGAFVFLEAKCSKIAVFSTRETGIEV